MSACSFCRSALTVDKSSVVPGIACTVVLPSAPTTTVTVEVLYVPAGSDVPGTGVGGTGGIGGTGGTGGVGPAPGFGNGWPFAVLDGFRKYASASVDISQG